MLLEHLSEPDRFARLRLLGYQTRGWDHARLRSPPVLLPGVVPVVLSQGPRPWSPPPIVALQDARVRALAARYTPAAEVVTIDLAVRTVDALLALPVPPLLRAALVLMKVAREQPGDMDGALLLVLDRLAGGAMEPALRAGLRALLVYTLAVTQRLPRRETIEEIRRRAGPAVGEVFMTAYEQLLQQGRVEGERTGEAKGMRGLLARQLQVKFGPLDGETGLRLAHATIDDVARWGERLLGATTLAEVFGDA